MQVKRSSWHYKISNLFCSWEKLNDSICIYFWRLIGTILFLSFAVFFFSVLIYTWFIEPLWISNTIAASFVFLSFILPFFAIYYLRSWRGDLSTELPYENIIVEYIKAKKNKICPLIKYID